MGALTEERTLLLENQQSIADEHRLLAEQMDLACLALDKSFSQSDKRSPSDVGSVLHILVDLIETAEAHFYHEEFVMKKEGFPGLFFHKRDHDDLLKKLNRYAASLSGGRLPESVCMSADLKSWLGSHTKNFDEPYAAFAQSRTREMED